MPFDLKWDGLYKIISGGQTGADQGGLSAAWKAGVETGGQAPAHYKTQTGFNPLLEILGLTEGGDYADRTRVNVETADGTVIIAHHLNSPGSALTRRAVKAAGKPLLQLDIFNLTQLALEGQTSENEAIMLDGIITHGQKLANFISEHKISILNVAGNREIIADPNLHGTKIVFQITEWIVSFALELIASDNKLILKEHFSNNK